MKNLFIILFILIVIGLVWFAFFGVQNGDDTTLIEDVVDTEIIEEQDISNNEEAIMKDNQRVTLKTNKGDIIIELYGEKMPITAGNFFKLAQSGFYDDTKFHRVIPGFMIQGGDPNSKGDNTSIYGQGGPGYAIEDEHVVAPELSNVRGTISMANSGPNSGGSQFFINLGNNTNLDFDKEPLGSKHPVFGVVVEGMDIVDSIAGVETGANDIPVEPVIIESILLN